MRHGLACVCVVVLVGMAEGQQSKPALDKATLAKVRELQEKRRDVLREALTAHQKLFQTGQGTLGKIVETSKRLLAAELDLATTDAERIAACQKHLEYARQWFEITKAKHEVGAAMQVDILEAQAVLLSAEIVLLKVGGKLKNAEK